MTVYLVLLLSINLFPVQIQALPSALLYGEKGAPQGDSQAQQLEPGRPIGRELAGGQTHSYRITMTSGQYLEIAVDQKGIDVAVALFAPDDKKLSEVDSPNGPVGPETVTAIAEEPGAYRIEVRSPDKAAQPGRYGIKVVELKAATAADKDRVAGDSVFQEGDRLRNGTLDDRRKSIEKFSEALELYRKAGNRRGEAGALNNIGLVHQSLGEMQKALAIYNEALPIIRAINDRSDEASMLNNIGQVYQSLGETQKALDHHNQALSITRTVGDRNIEALTLNDLGSVYFALGEVAKALEMFNQALPIFRSVGYRNAEAVMFNNIGECYRALGEMQKALDHYDQALPILRMVGDRGSESQTLANIGAAYILLGEIAKALEKFNEAYSIKKAMGDRVGEARVLNDIGVAYGVLGERRKQLEALDQALQIRRAIGDRKGEADTLSNIGVAYAYLGELQKALDHYNQSLPIRKAIGDRRGEAVTLNNIGEVYGSLGERQKELDYYRQALTIARATGYRTTEVSTLNNIGLVYLQLEEMEKARESFNQALPISQAIGDRNEEARTLVGLGRIYNALGERTSALEKFDQALSINRAIGERKGETNTLYNIGKLHLSSGEMEKARERFNEALPIYRAIGDRRGEADTLLSRAQVEQRQGNLAEARPTIEQAISIIESLRTGIGSQELRASYFASQQKFYESHLDVLMQMHRQSPAASLAAAAFATSERARARSLLELLTEARADIRQGVDAALLERARALQQRLAAKATAKTNLLNSRHSPAQAEAVAKEIASITTEYEELEARIRASSPKYAALIQPQPLNLSEIQQQVLDPETLLLEYSLGENASYLFVVSNTSIASHQLPKRSEIEAATRQVRDLLTAPQPRSGDTIITRQARIREARANYWPQAAALSRMLLGPAAEQLGNKRLLIVADGALQYLPFGALPVPEIPGQGERESGGAGERRKIPPAPPLPRSPTPLIVEHEIVHLPSASTLAILRRELAGRQPAPKAVAVLADPVFSADDARVKLRGRNLTAQNAGETSSNLTRALTDVRGELSRLLMTRDEAQAILSLTPPNSRLEALDFRASRATSTSDELSQYRIVHFATHGLLNSQHPKLSGLILSLVDERGQPQDGFLQLHEIFNLRLPAELVVLSACQTGLGKEIRGEGLVGLTRGFMYAGAARVMASLWQVEDAATSELMKRFYREMLQEGKRPAAALRAAQIEMWRRPRWESPYYWGAFVLQGEWK